MNFSVFHTMQALAASLPIRVLQPEEVLFGAGEPGTSIICVLGGAIELRWGDAGHETFGSGDVLGVEALLSENHGRHGTVRALVATELIELGREQFLAAVQENPMFAIELMASLERRLRRLEP